MKTSQIFYFLLTVILFSCSDGNRNANVFGGDSATNKYQSQNRVNAQNLDGERTKNYKIIDPRDNSLIGTMPFPSNWNPSNDPQAILEGPDGIKVFKEKVSFFSYNNDPSTNQMAKQAGENVKTPISVENFIKQELIPFAQQQGAQFVKQYPIEQLARFDQAHYNKFYRFSLIYRRHNVIAVEFKGKNGKASIVIVRHHSGEEQQGTIWGYVLNMMEANASSFEQAKQNYLYSLMNVQINPIWIQACYERDTKIAQYRKERTDNESPAFSIDNLFDDTARMGDREAIYDDYWGDISNPERGMEVYKNVSWNSVDIKEFQKIQESNENQYQIEGYDTGISMNRNKKYIETYNTGWDPNFNNSKNVYSWDQLYYQNTGGW